MAAAAQESRQQKRTAAEATTARKPLPLRQLCKMPAPARNLPPTGASRNSPASACEHSARCGKRNSFATRRWGAGLRPACVCYSSSGEDVVSWATLPLTASDCLPPALARGAGPRPACATAARSPCRRRRQAATSNRRPPPPSARFLLSPAARCPARCWLCLLPKIPATTDWQPTGHCCLSIAPRGQLPTARLDASQAFYRLLSASCFLPVPPPLRGRLEIHQASNPA
jgi:hypothetical protein